MPGSYLSVASLFRLNRAKYRAMKEDGGKTEF